MIPAPPVFGRCLIAASIALGLLALAPAAEAESRPNRVSLQGGAMIGIAEYRSWLEVSGGYARWLSGATWLDLGASALVHHDTNLALLGGVRWVFNPPAARVRPFLRTGLELAILLEASRRFVVGGRVGGGVGYYSSPGFGATLEAGLVLGPAFGDGVHFASALDLLLGVEFPF